MIDPLTEQLISLTEAAKLCPKRRSGKRPHVSCVYRWTATGCKGVKLESLQVGGTRCTSREALGRFFERLSQVAGLDRTVPTIRTPSQRARADAQAKREIMQWGR
jgi:hypothetical protein